MCDRLADESRQTGDSRGLLGVTASVISMQEGLNSQQASFSTEQTVSHVSAHNVPVSADGAVPLHTIRNILQD